MNSARQPRYRRRYARLRYEDPEFPSSSPDRWSGNMLSEDECLCAECLYGFIEYGDELDWFHFDQLLDEQLRSTSSFPDLPDTSSTDSWSRPGKRAGLEERLVGHLQDIAMVKKSLPGAIENTQFRIRLDQAIGLEQNREVLTERLASGVSLATLKHLCLFAPFWIRPPASWDPTGSRSLLEHLFVQFQSHPGLNREWKSSDPNLKWLSWYIVLGQGGSLKRTGDLAGWNVSKRFTRFFLEAPNDLAPADACMYAEVRALGGIEQDFRRLFANSNFHLDPTQESESASFWYDTARWLIRSRDHIDNYDSWVILDWAHHRFTEGKREYLLRRHRNYRPGSPEGSLFRWKGRTAASVLRQACAYRANRMRKTSSNACWHARGWGWQLEEDNHCWNIEELTSARELYEEGAALDHCVADYVSYCLRGESVILSLKCDGERCLTIEINPKTGAVMQAYGFRNRRATAEEMAVLTQWLRVLNTRVAS